MDTPLSTDELQALGLKSGLDFSEMSEDVRTSVLNAIQHGYVQYDHTKSKSYPSLVHPLTGLKWIHYIKPLMGNLRVSRFEELEAKNYDVSAYYLYNATEYDKQRSDYFRWLELHTHTSNLVDEYIKIHTVTRCEPQDFREDIRINYTKLNTEAFIFASQDDITEALIKLLYKKLDFLLTAIELLQRIGSLSATKLNDTNLHLLSKLNKLKTELMTNDKQ
ncbi:hypothetical protein KBB49_04465 [Candidatus Saccharibacteria bacterium]|nr:hypothetical protein [Candidatus Saccharibacteria bacterium]